MPTLSAKLMIFLTNHTQMHKTVLDRYSLAHLVHFGISGEKIMLCLALEIQLDFVDVTPPPALTRLKRLHDGVFCGVEVLRRMFVL